MIVASSVLACMRLPSLSIVRFLDFSAVLSTGEQLDIWVIRKDEKGVRPLICQWGRLCLHA